MKRVYVRLAGLLIAVMLVLSGCNLVGTDLIMQLDQQLAAKVQQYSAVVASYDGGEITQEDVMASFTSQYSYMNQLYTQYYGTGVPSDLLESIKEGVVQNEIQHIAIDKELEKRGLTLDDDKLAEVKAHSDEDYQSVYDSFYANAEGKTDDVRAKQTEYDLYVNGYTREALYNLDLATAKHDMLQEVVEAEITEADLTDEKLQEAYDEKVSADEDTYTSSPSSYGSAMTNEGTVVYWVPEGYRTVKHILVKPDDGRLRAVTDARYALSDAQANLDALYDELDALDDDAEDEGDEDALPEEAPRTAEEIKADIDKAEADIEPLKADVEAAEAACLASVKETTDEIYAKIEAGEDFEALIEAYGEDPGMQSEPAKTIGYYVCDESTNWDANFKAGAMALENVGDITQTPVISTSGVHIIRYESDVTAGAVPLEDIREKLYDTTLETAREDHFIEALEGWTSALNPVYHADAFTLG